MKHVNFFPFEHRKIVEEALAREEKQQNDDNWLPLDTTRLPEGCLTMFWKGIAAERAVCKLFNIRYDEIIYEHNHGDGGGDVRLPTGLSDIKATGGLCDLLVKKTKGGLKADYYVLCWTDVEHHSVTIVGYATRDEVALATVRAGAPNKKTGRVEHENYYIPYTQLHSIEELVEGTYDEQGLC